MFERFWDLYRSDCETLVDVEKRLQDLYHIEMPTELPDMLKGDSVRVIWKTWLEGLSNYDEMPWLGVSLIKSMIAQCQTNSGEKGKQLFVPLRFVVLGKTEGADLTQVASLLPRKELVRRVSLYLHTS